VQQDLVHARIWCSRKHTHTLTLTHTHTSSNTHVLKRWQVFDELEGVKVHKLVFIHIAAFCGGLHARGRTWEVLNLHLHTRQSLHSHTHRCFLRWPARTWSHLGGAQFALAHKTAITFTHPLQLSALACTHMVIH